MAGGAPSTSLIGSDFTLSPPAAFPFSPTESEPVGSQRPAVTEAIGVVAEVTAKVKAGATIGVIEVAVGVIEVAGEFTLAAIADIRAAA